MDIKYKSQLPKEVKKNILEQGKLKAKSFDEIVKKWNPLLKRFAYKYKFMDFDDAYQTCLICAWEAYVSYIPEYAFYTHLNMRLHYCLLNECKKYKKKQLDIVSLQTEVEDIGTIEDLLGKDDLNYEKFIEYDFFRIILAKLSRSELEVFFESFSKQSKKEFAKKYNLSEKAIYNRIDSVINKVRIIYLKEIGGKL
jgi:RNA polymerase sigma factor (sigma-70 family)